MMKESNDIVNNYGFYNDYGMLRDLFPWFMRWCDKYRYKKTREYFIRKMNEGMIKFKKDCRNGRVTTYPDFGSTNFFMTCFPPSSLDIHSLTCTPSSYHDVSYNPFTGFRVKKEEEEEKKERSRQLFGTMGVVGKMINDKS